MRPLSEADIDAYITSFPKACLSTPGAYQIESGGAHLFTDMSGTGYDILGFLYCRFWPSFVNMA